MKLAVFSDSHGNSENMIRAVSAYAPEQILFLGDGADDLRALERAFPQIPICAVAGNCDGWCELPQERIVTLCGQRIFLAHGHRHSVRRDPLVLFYDAQSKDCRLALYGHTHEAGFEQYGDVFLLNPGSVGMGPRRTWAKLEIDRGGIVRCEIEEIRP